MAGSARSLAMSFFSGLRVASTAFTPQYSKNGNNVNAKLVVNAFMNIASKANNGKGRNEAIPFTFWGKLADVGAKSMSPGKEFNAIAQLHVYMGRVFNPSAMPGQPGTPVLMPDGSPLLTKKFSFTVSMMTFGEESDKHIANEIQAGVRPIGWNVAGSVENQQWTDILKQRQTIQFNQQLPTYGYARVTMPNGPGIAAYIQNAQPVVAAAAGPAVDTAAAVAATFAGVHPAGAGVVTGVQVQPGPIAQPGPIVQPGGFIAPPGV